MLKVMKVSCQPKCPWFFGLKFGMKKVLIFLKNSGKIQVLTKIRYIFMNPPKQLSNFEELRVNHT